MGNRSPRIAKKSASKQIRSPLRALPPPQVDERLNGDGTGLILGINDEILGFILLTIPALVFSQFFYAQKDEGIAAGAARTTSGLSLSPFDERPLFRRSDGARTRRLATGWRVEIDAGDGSDTRVRA